MASPLMLNSGFATLDPDFGHCQAVIGFPKTSSRMEQGQAFSLEFVPHRSHEIIQDTMSSTGRSSIDSSTAAITISDLFRDWPLENNCRAVLDTAITSPCTGEVLSTAPRRDPFRNPKCLREASLKMKPLNIYPCSRGEISKDYDEHFDEIALMLKKSISRNPNIISSVGNDILYQMLKVGSSPEDVCAAIVVVCEEEIFAQVRDTLYEPRILRECNLYNPTTTQRTIYSWLKKLQGPTDHNQRQPYMPLYIYAGKPVTSLHQTLDSTPPVSGNLETVSDLTLCGAKIVTADRSKSATITCVVKLDAGRYGLTAAHTFRDGCINDTQVNHKPWNSIEAKCFLYPSGNDQFVESSIYLPAPSFFGPMTADLDWGLVELSDDCSTMVNAYMCQDSFKSRLEITGVAAHHPQMERNVLILTSASTPLTGILLDEYTYRAAIGKGTSRLWSVEVDYGQELVKGHSGSLVIDTDTGEAYGYIVAIDIFGKAQVVPLCSAFEQIQNWASTSDIVLADRTRIHQTQMMPVLSTPLSGQSLRLKRRNSSTDLPESCSSNKRRETLKTTDTDDPSNSGLGSPDVVGRLQALQQRLHLEQHQIDQTDLDFLKTLVKSIQDHRDSCNSRESMAPLDIDMYASQALDRHGIEFVSSSSKDIRQNEIGKTQSTELHSERIFRSMSVGEQHSINKLETNRSEQIASKAVDEQIVEMSFDRRKGEGAIISRQNIIGQESQMTDKAIRKWAEDLSNAITEHSSLGGAKHLNDLDSNKSETDQSGSYDSDYEYHYNHKDDRTSVTSFQATSLKSLRRTVPPRTGSFGTLPLSIHTLKEHQPGFLEFLRAFARFPSELPYQIEYDDLEKFFLLKHSRAQSEQQVKTGHSPALPTDFLVRDMVIAKDKQNIAKLYRGYQKEFRPMEPATVDKFKCTLGCAWSHRTKSNWERHERTHYPQEIWICCHEDCLNKSHRTRVSFRKDLARRHYADHHCKEKDPDITDRQLEDIRVRLADSMFPRECVFEGCFDTFSTFDERSAHIEHHLKSQDRLCRSRIIKHYSPEHSDVTESTIALRNTGEQISETDSGFASTNTANTLRKPESVDRLGHYPVSNKIGPLLHQEHRVQKSQPSSARNSSNLKFTKIGDKHKPRYHFRANDATSGDGLPFRTSRAGLFNLNEANTENGSQRHNHMVTPLDYPVFQPLSSGPPMDFVPVPDPNSQLPASPGLMVFPRNVVLDLRLHQQAMLEDPRSINDANTIVIDGTQRSPSAY